MTKREVGGTDEPLDRSDLPTATELGESVEATGSPESAKETEEEIRQRNALIFFARLAAVQRFFIPKTNDSATIGDIASWIISDVLDTEGRVTCTATSAEGEVFEFAFTIDELMESNLSQFNPNECFPNGAEVWVPLKESQLFFDDGRGEGLKERRGIEKGALFGERVLVKAQLMHFDDSGWVNAYLGDPPLRKPTHLRALIEYGNEFSLSPRQQHPKLFDGSIPPPAPAQVIRREEMPEILSLIASVDSPLYLFPKGASVTFKRKNEDIDGTVSDYRRKDQSTGVPMLYIQFKGEYEGEITDLAKPVPVYDLIANGSHPQPEKLRQFPVGRTIHLPKGAVRAKRNPKTLFATKLPAPTLGKVLGLKTTASGEEKLKIQPCDITGKNTGEPILLSMDDVQQAANAPYNPVTDFPENREVGIMVKNKLGGSDFKKAKVMALNLHKGDHGEVTVFFTEKDKPFAPSFTLSDMYLWNGALAA